MLDREVFLFHSRQDGNLVMLSHVSCTDEYNVRATRFCTYTCIWWRRGWSGVTWETPHPQWTVRKDLSTWCPLLLSHEHMSIEIRWWGVCVNVYRRMWGQAWQMVAVAVAADAGWVRAPPTGDQWFKDRSYLWGALLWKSHDNSVEDGTFIPSDNCKWF